VEAPSYVISFYYRKILVPVDGSETSLKALLVAADIAMRYGSRLVVVYAKPRGVEEPVDPLARARERLRGVPVNAAYKQIEYDPASESPSSALLREIAEGGYDLVVVGARGRSLLGDINIGSVAVSIAISAPTSVFVVR